MIQKEKIMICFETHLEDEVLFEVVFHDELMLIYEIYLNHFLVEDLTQITEKENLLNLEKI